MALIEFIQTALSYVGPFVILLGLLIFVHEFGHFFVAKMCNVRVEVFSLGFGKKILSHKRGDTTYCVSLIPLGGYVKMFGDDPSAEISPEEQKHSFLHKPVGQRIAIVLAGPLMNLFFAAITFALIAFIGEKQTSPNIGDISKDSTAYSYGFRSGDRISSIDGKDFSYWAQIKEYIQSKPNDDLSFQVEREHTKELVNFSASTKLIPNENLLSTERMVGAIDGLEVASTAPVVAIPKKSFAGKNFDLPRITEFTKIAGQEVRYLRDLKRVLSNSRGQVVEVEYNDFLKREENIKPVLAKIKLPNSENVFNDLGFDQSHLYLYEIKEDSPAEIAGFKPGDKIISVDGQKISGWKNLVEKVKSYTGRGQLTFVVLRSGEEITLQAKPEMSELLKPSGADDDRFTVGIVPAITMVAPPTITIKYSNIFSALNRGAVQSWRWTKTVMISFVRMIQSEVSSRNIGGVITIGKYAGQSYQVGITSFLNLMAIISINLFLINLFPVPVLDGGHLLFFTIEAIRGAPLSMKKMEMAQQVGLIILMSLMAFALFNDISNIINPPF